MFADAERSVGPRGAPKPGSVSPALFHGEKERLNRNCSNDSRSWFNSQMPYDVLPQNARTEFGEVRVSNTLHLTRPTEIQNLAKPEADRAVPRKTCEIPQQPNGGRAVLTQTGHSPGRSEAHSQTTVQCSKNEILQQQKNSSRAVLTRLEAQGQTAVQCRQNENLQEQNSSGTVSTQLGYAPGRL